MKRRPRSLELRIVSLREETRRELDNLEKKKRMLIAIMIEFRLFSAELVL